MVDFKKKYMIISSKNYLLKRYITNYIISQRILIIFMIFYIKMQHFLCDNSGIILKMKDKGNITIIYKDFKKYLSEVYINDVSMTNIETYYNFTVADSTVKLVFNSQINNCNKMFMDCKNINEINFTNFDASNITNLSETFKNCNKLKSIDLPNWDISKVIDINSLFQNCNGLTSIELPNFKNSNITTMNSVFRSCKSLKTLDFLRIDTSKVTNMAYMFADCGTLTSLDLSHRI